MKKLLACLLVVGCGGDDGVSGEPLPLDNYATESAAVTCAFQFDCCTAAEIMELYDGVTFEDEVISTEEQCTRFATALLTSFGVNQFRDSIAKGRIEYSADRAGDCLAAIRGLTCAEYAAGDSLEVTACRAFVIPKVGDGGACLRDYECTSNNCVGEQDSFGDNPVDGACAELPGLDEECNDNCADGLYCKSSQQTPVDSCQPLESNGSECDGDSSCASNFCDAQNVCADEAPICDGQ